MKRILVPVLLLAPCRIFPAEAPEQILTVINSLEKKIILSYTPNNLPNSRETVSMQPKESVTLLPIASKSPNKKYLHVKVPAKQKLGSFLLPPATTKYWKVIIVDKHTPRGPDQDTSYMFDVGNSSGDELIFFE